MFIVQVVLLMAIVFAWFGFLLSIIYNDKITEYLEKRKHKKLAKKFKVLNDQEMDEVWFRM